MRMAAAVAAVMFTLAACGGGGGKPVSVAQPPDRTPPAAPPDAGNNRYAIHPGIPASDAKRSPVYRTGDLLRVGIDQGPGPERLPKTALAGLPDVEVRHGRIDDGAGAAELRRYLSSLENLSRRLPRHEVRVIGPSTAEERKRVLAAVQLVNAALPEGARLSVGTPLPGFSLRHTVDSGGRYHGGIRRLELPRTIHIEFTPASEFHSRTVAATSWGEYILASRDGFPAYADQRKAVILMAHELIHSLGIGGHVPETFDTIMEATSRIHASAQGSRQPGSLLYPVDREALRALYGPLLNSADPDDLGPWSGTSEHLYVGNAHGAFGVALRNGYAEPWAYGTAPATDLAANRSLSGSAAWAGALVGFTPAAKRVAGEAGIAVDLATLDGSAAFTGLAVVEADGRTPQWGDGDLRYTIAVRGNTFRETGGDDGRLTGMFAGRAHEAASGTLERPDLTAAFGAVR